MPTKSKKQPLQLSDPVPSANFNAVIEKLSARDRGNITRYMEAEHPPKAVGLWKKMFCVMAALSPHAIQATGQLAVQFFVADGKHRLQIFALEDTDKTPGLQLYIPDCLQQATAGGLLGKPQEVDGVMRYPIREGRGESLAIEPLTAAGTVNAPEFFRHMLGWNRKAIRVVLLESATTAEVQAAGILCVLGAALRVPEGSPVAK